MNSKKKAENLFNSKTYKSYEKSFRLPRIITRSNYNMLGFYEGEKMEVIDKFINKFLEN